MNTQPRTQQFLQDVAQHKMTVLRDDGVYRHIRFKAPGTLDMHFDLITWPGYLCYTGDMGTYVFTRLTDMFEFFRTKPERDAGLYINLGYWAEKCVAADRDGIKEYSADKFRSVIAEYVDGWREEHGWDEMPEGLREEVDDVLSAADDGEYAAHDAVYRFSYADDEHGKFEFSDFFEYSLHEYTFRFVWCCYALAWGIRVYDQMTGPPAIAAPPSLRGEAAAP